MKNKNKNRPFNANIEGVTWRILNLIYSNFEGVLLNCPKKTLCWISMSIYSKRFAILLSTFLSQYFIFNHYFRTQITPIYGTNDDALISSIASGTLTGSYESHWIFIKSLLSMPATILQSKLDLINIYSWILILSVFYAFSLLVLNFFLISQIKARIIFLLWILLGYIIFVPWFSISPTYTGAAVFLGASGFSTLYLTINREGNKFLDLNIYAGIAISLSFLIRTESFALSFMLFLVMTCWLLVRKQKINFNSLVAPIAILLIVFTSNFFLDKLNYKDESWSYYLELNQLRHSIQLRAPEKKVELIAVNINWTQDDYVMFRKFSLIDQEKFNSDALEVIMDESRFDRGVFGLLRADPLSKYNYILNSYKPFTWIIIFLIFIAISSLALVKNMRSHVYSLIVLFLAFSAISYLLAASYQLPERITFNFLFLVYVFLLSSFFLHQLNDSNIAFALIGLSSLISIIIASAATCDRLVSRSTLNQTMHEVFDSQREYLNSDENTFIYIATGSRLRESWQDPYAGYQKISTSDNVIFLGWHNFSPLWNKQVSNLGLNPDTLIKDAIDSERVIWVEDIHMQNTLQSFLMNYSGSQIAVIDIGYVGTPDYRAYLINKQ